MEGDRAGKPDEPEPKEPESASFLDRLTLKHLWRAVVVTALVTTAAFGGLDKMPPSKPVKLGEQYNNGPLLITVTDVFISCYPEKLGHLFRNALLDGAEKDATVVLAEADIVSTATESVPLDQTISPTSKYRKSLTDIFELEAEVRAYTGQFRMTDDNLAQVSKIGPKSKYKVAMLWAVPRDAIKVGDQVTLRLYDIEQYEMLIAAQFEWAHVRGTETYGELTTAVKDDCK